jgi:hypothetical protein
MMDALQPRGRTLPAARRALIVLTTVLVVMGATGGAFANTPPVADAGLDQTVCLGEPVMLMGYAEDPDGDPIVCWDWAIDSAPEGSLADLPHCMFPDPGLVPDLPGDYVLSLVVDDGLDYSLPDIVTIHVTEYLPPTDAATAEAAQLTSAEAGGIVGWGYNHHGQAAPPPGLADVVAIDAGVLHSLALQSDGTVVGWGFNPSGQATPPPDLADVVAIAAGFYHSLALTADGEVIAWGWNVYGECNVPVLPEGLTYTTIAAGQYHALALRSDGTLVGWGSNAYGTASPPLDLTDVVAIDGGLYHSLALRSDGTVVGWGYNASGQATPPLDLADVIAIAAGDHHSLALQSDGTIVGWGWDYYGQASPPLDLTDVVAIAAAKRHGLALQSDGTVAGWGNNSMGQATPPLDLADVVAIAAGGDHSLALVASSPEAQLVNMEHLIQDQVGAGSIAPELEGPLLAKVGAALSALDRGNPNDAKVAMNDLKALVNQVEAQTDKKIDPDAAADIIARATSIIAALGG